MQVRDLIEQLQQFDPKSSVSFEVTIEDCEVKRGPDTARIILEG